MPEQTPPPLSPAETPEQAHTPNSSPPPPDWESLPLLLTPAQIGQALGIKTEIARTSGNRGHYGPKTERKRGRQTLTYYERANVEASWRSRHQPMPLVQSRPETAIQPNSSVSSLITSLETLAASTETMLASTRRSETDAETIAQLVAQNGDLQTQVQELTAKVRELEAEGKRYERTLFGLFRKKA